MNFRTVRRVASAILAMGCILVHTPTPLHAQSTFGSVRGTATDPTRAVIPGAQITLHSLDENTNVVVMSDEAGNFVLENLKPGHYTNTGAKEGFANAVVNQVAWKSRWAIGAASQLLKVHSARSKNSLLKGAGDGRSWPSPA